MIITECIKRKTPVAEKAAGAAGYFRPCRLKT